MKIKIVETHYISNADKTVLGLELPANSKIISNQLKVNSKILEISSKLGHVKIRFGKDVKL